MTERVPDTPLPVRGTATRSLVFVLSALLGLVFYFVIVNPLDRTHFLWAPELRSQDWLVRMRPKPAPHPDVIQVAVNNQKTKLVDDRGNPVEGRSLYADLIRRLTAAGAKVIVLDTFLPDRTTRPEDQALWRAMADSGRVFMPVKYDPRGDNVLSDAEILNLREIEESVLHGSILSNSADPMIEQYTWWRFQAPVWDFTRNAGGPGGGVGMATYQSDPDNVTRTVQWAYLTNIVYPAGLPPSPLQQQWDVANVAVPNAALSPVLRFVEVGKDLVVVYFGRYLQLAGDLNPPILLPMDEWGRAPISFVGGPGTIPVVNAADVLDGSAPEGTFRGKLVVLGVWGPFEAADNLVTPFSQAHPRMDVSAQVISSVLTRKPLARVTHMAFIPLVLLGIVAGIVIPWSLNLLKRTLAALAVLLAYLIVAIIAASAGVLIPMISAVFLVLLSWLLTMIFTAIFGW